MSTASATPKLRRALLATADKDLPALLNAMLAPVGFAVQTIAPDKVGDIPHNDYVILMLDGDPHVSIDDIMPAVVVIAPTDPVAMYDEGADLVVPKPLVANVFMAKIRAVLRRYGVMI